MSQAVLEAPPREAADRAALGYFQKPLPAF